MIRSDLITKGSILFGAASFLFSFLLFYYYTGEFWSCIAAAILSACLFWASYLFFRLIYLSFRR